MKKDIFKYSGRSFRWTDFLSGKVDNPEEKIRSLNSLGRQKVLEKLKMP